MIDVTVDAANEGHGLLAEPRVQLWPLAWVLLWVLVAVVVVAWPLSWLETQQASGLATLTGQVRRSRAQPA